ncbi:hypothetical protein L226DRAFT_142665 [Lentinus tigrinus ALCF2SS1-7]|uniref:F-box domain-containing protein n=1 Tax=Lentinus tigrinus ALCF2SS1-6 TaxID=1328759 RepID=A0A5C2SA62_9APHY|nr:hypothetical protein L227DRAFT_654906 [Lentinus tigrinus ALCF2SS1-6]RPD72996.1 hypothetical protein L226DRAFT_142665 [Lentinus tigrinus ALCF2SS1-7]
MAGAPKPDEVNSRFHCLESNQIILCVRRVEKDTEALSQALLPKPPINPKHPTLPMDTHLRQRNIQEYFSWKRSIPGLPVEIISEIASHMHPLDLLSYSRTSKAYRKILLSRGSRVAWNASLATVPDLPPCPPDMSQPKYAALIFDCHCFACGADDANAVDYALRVRFCDECFSANVSDATEVFRELPRYVRDAVLLLLPTTNTLGNEICEALNTTFIFRPDTDFDRVIPGPISLLNAVAHIDQDLFYIPELRAIVEWFWPLPTAESFVRAKKLLRQRVEYVTQRQTHAALLLAWNRIIGNMPLDASDPLPYIYAYELAQLSISFEENRHLGVPPPADNADDDGSYDDVDQCELDARVDAMKVHLCSSLPPKNPWQVAEEERLRERREAVARHKRIETRKGELEMWYQIFVCLLLDRSAYDYSTFPNVYDGARLWDYLIDSQARTPIASCTFLDALGEDLDAKIDSYVYKVEDALKALIVDPGIPRIGRDGRQIYWYQNSNKSVLLERPIAMFTCDKCDKDAEFPWPDINVHWCTAHPHDSIWARNNVLNLSWWRDGARTAEEIVYATGLEAMAILSLDLAVKTGRLYCSCGDPSLEQPEKLNWAKLVRHVLEHDRMNDRIASADNVASKSDASSLVWINDHVPEACMKYSPNPNMEAASKRVRAEPDMASRITKWLDHCHGSSVPQCSICYALSPRKNKKDTWAHLSATPDAIVYHMQAKHGKTFEESDVQFYRV